MNADQAPTPRRRIAVRLTAREKNDLLAHLAAVQSALSCQASPLSGQPDAPGEAPPPVEAILETILVKEDGFATSLRREVQAALDAKAAENERKAARDRLTAARDEAEIAALRAGTRSYVAFLFTKGLRVTVEIYEKSVKAVAGVASRVFGAGGEKAE